MAFWNTSSSQTRPRGWREVRCPVPPSHRCQQPEVYSAISEAYPPSQRILGKAHSARNGFSVMTPTLAGNYKIPEGSSESENSICFYLFLCYRKEDPAECSYGKSTEREGDHREMQQRKLFPADITVYQPTAAQTKCLNKDQGLKFHLESIQSKFELAASETRLLTLAGRLVVTNTEQDIWVLIQ